jgi:hypothetical protein
MVTKLITKKTKLAKKLKQAKEKSKPKQDTAHDAQFMASSLLLSSVLESAREEYNDSLIAAAGDLDVLTIGIKMPFVMQYILQNNVMPLGRIFELVGEEKSNKSTLAFEIGRWFNRELGNVYIFENETKFSEDMAMGVMGHTDEMGRPQYVHLPSGTQEDWQSKITTTLKAVKHGMLNGASVTVGNKTKKYKPTGRTIPVLFILDSLAGAVAEENVIKINKKGFSGRNHPAEALSNTTYFKKFRADLVKWPVSLLIVNHLRKQKAENGQHIERKTPGGKHVAFQQSFQLELTKIKPLSYVDTRKNAVALSVTGNRIKIQCRRSGMGEDLRSANVDMLIWYEKKNGVVRQYTKWQWSAALVDLLLEQDGSAKERIREVVDIRQIKNKFWSNKLKISKDKPLTKAEIGEKIENNASIVAKLSDLFAIKQRIVMSKGDDYKKLLRDSRKEAKKKLEE